jgi:hypothetical protein
MLRSGVDFVTICCEVDGIHSVAHTLSFGAVRSNLYVLPDASYAARRSVVLDVWSALNRVNVVAVATHETNVELPTEADPQCGSIGVGDAVLSSAVRWVEDDGTHVVRSLEFDVYGEGETWDEAFSNFMAHADDLLSLLASVKEEGTATEHEEEIGRLLGTRLLTFYQEVIRLLDDQLEAETRRTAAFMRLLDLRKRPSRPRVDFWPPTHPMTSSKLSPV